MPGGSPQEFDALLKAWGEAIVANDPQAISRFVEPDWVLVGANGIYARERLLTDVASET